MPSEFGGAWRCEGTGVRVLFWCVWCWGARFYWKGVSGVEVVSGVCSGWCGVDFDVTELGLCGGRCECRYVVLSFGECVSGVV